MDLGVALLNAGSRWGRRRLALCLSRSPLYLSLISLLLSPLCFSHLLSVCRSHLCLPLSSLSIILFSVALALISIHHSTLCPSFSSLPLSLSSLPLSSLSVALLSVYHSPLCP